MPPSKLRVNGRIIPLEKLTPSSFSPFGNVIEDPASFMRPKNTNPPPPASHLQTPIFANQGTARKYSNISLITNEYTLSSRPSTAKATMSLFVCSPRKLAPVRGGDAGLFHVTIMERHPYTTQTFSPLGLGLDSHTDESEKTAYLVIVAPTSNEDKPDVSQAKAFVANGAQAVTYGVATWHAPMVVVGQKELPFLVTQFTNGIAEDDCQEVEFECADGEEVSVVVHDFVSRNVREKAKI
jgi:ureidoglycolate lyase